jgi:uncharacterized protein YdeI (YjbR/CyaY-like superfamily)
MSAIARATSLKTDSRVDKYVANAALFAHPILRRLRELVHKACPGVEETIKWSRPFFEYHGTILCNMSAFKEHCSFGFWGSEMAPILREANALGNEGMGSLGRLTSLHDLPSDRQLLAWIRQAASFVDKGEHMSPIAARRTVVKAEKPALGTPSEFTVALRKNERAAAIFAAFSPSCKREYIEWIAGAKRPETREKRIATAIEWIEQGKQRHWKYQN